MTGLDEVDSAMAEENWSATTLPDWTVLVNGDFKRFGGDVADSACVAVIEEAPGVIDACRLEPTGDAELDVL